jgi:SMI1-KNR4 cell-wall
MGQFEINKDEFDTTLDRIEVAEKFWQNKFPEDYKTFLLKNNGGQIYPNYPSLNATFSSEIWDLEGIERFLSVEDLVLQKLYPMGYTYNEYHEESVLGRYNLNLKDKFNVNLDFLMTIAVAERGCYYINLDPLQFGQIYFANYQGGDGFVRVETNSFTEFINSLRPYRYAEKDFVNIFSTTKKVYDIRFFHTPNNPELGLQRLKEVLSFLGDANSKSTPSDWTVIQFYAYSWFTNEMDRRILIFLLENGGKIDGLLNRTRDIQTIKLLITKYHANINQEYNGRYPLLEYTGWGSTNSVKENYELIDKLLDLNLNIDFSITDDKNQNIIERLRLLALEYEKNKAFSLEQWKDYPHMHTYITSENINKLIATK